MIRECGGGVLRVRLGRCCLRYAIVRRTFDPIGFAKSLSREEEWTTATTG